MNHARLPFRQRGIVTVLAAILLFAGIIYWLQQTYGIIGNTSQSNATQLDSIKAFFVAESGLERGLGQLKGAGDPSLQTACTDISGGPHTLATGETFTLLATASGCDTSTPPTNCTSCTIRSTGSVGTASRTVESVIALTAPSGGAIGCGGGGTATCPVSGVTSIYPNIEQSITVTTAPVVLVSNMAFLRHPQAAANNVDAAGCVTFPPSGPCLTRTNLESNSSAGIQVIGGRTASVAVSATGTYQFTQNLTASSLFAAVGASFGGSGAGPQVVGSYWDDQSTGSGNKTVDQGTGTIGSTNNGAACSSAPGTADCPPEATAANATYSTRQTSRNWCHDADTLVAGFSGSAGNATGKLNSFQFGTATSSTEVPNGSAIFVNPNTGANDKSPYTALRYIYNPYYLSGTDATSGAEVTAYAGVPFTATVYKSRTYIEASSVSGTIPNGGTLSAPPYITAGQTISYCMGTHPQLGIACGTGGAGAYNISADPNGSISGGPGTAVPNVATGIVTNTLTVVTPAPRPYLEVDDTITGTGVAANTTIQALGTGTGGTGTYTLSQAQTFPSTTITSNGATVTTSTSTPSGGPSTGTALAIRWTGSGTGALTSATTVASTTSGSQFRLSARPTTRLVNVQLCGGVCAYFIHSSVSAKTQFTVDVSNIGDWAVGLICLKGVDTSTIQGLSATTQQVRASSWTEVVR